MKRSSEILALIAMTISFNAVHAYACQDESGWGEASDVALDDWINCNDTGGSGWNGFDSNLWWNGAIPSLSNVPVQTTSNAAPDTRQTAPSAFTSYTEPALPAGMEIVTDPVPAPVAVAVAPAPIDPANNPFDPFSPSLPSSIGDVASAALVPTFPIMQSPIAFQDPGYLALVAPTVPVVAPAPVSAPVVAAVQTPLQQAVFGALPTAPAFQDSVPTVDAAGNPNDVARQPMQVAEVPSNGIPTFNATGTASADPAPAAAQPTTEVAYVPDGGVPTFTATAIANHGASDSWGAPQTEAEQMADVLNGVVGKGTMPVCQGVLQGAFGRTSGLPVGGQPCTSNADGTPPVLMGDAGVGSAMERAGLSAAALARVVWSDFVGEVAPKTAQSLVKYYATEIFNFMKANPELKPAESFRQALQNYLGGVYTNIETTYVKSGIGLTSISSLSMDTLKTSERELAQLAAKNAVEKAATGR
jgi:hypothetical protein